MDRPAKQFDATVTPAEIWAQDEPQSELVWEVCPYTRTTTADDTRCYRCSRTETEPDHGEVQRGCYGMAAEACRIVFAMQKRADFPA